MASTIRNYVIGGVVLVAILLLVSEHNSQTTSGGTDTSGARSCTVTITADSPLRSRAEGNAPVVGTLNKGVAVLAEPTVSNGYRQLGLSIWVAQEFLEPTPGSDCG